MSYFVGLTGGIGSGKSVVSRLLSVMGYPVYDSDSRASFVMCYDRTVVHDLTNLLGAATYRSDGTLNRIFIAEKIFADSSLLSKVNDIVHPAVLRDMLRWSREQSSEILFVESAILLTSVLRGCVSCVVSVISDRDLRISRIQKRSGLTIAQIEDRMNAQMSDQEITALSDYIIYNDCHHSLIEQAHSLIEHIIQNRNKAK